MNPGSNQLTLKQLLEQLSHGSDIVPLVARIGYDGRLTGRNDVTEAILSRDKLLASAVRTADSSWMVIQALSWVPNILNKKRIKKAIGNAFTSTNQPWYLLNALKENTNVLMDEEVMNGIVTSISSTDRFWFYLSHMQNLDFILEDDRVQELIERKTQSVQSDLARMKHPLSFIQSIKDHPEFFAQDSMQKVILEVIQKHGTPWEILMELKSITSLEHIQTHPEIVKTMEKHAEGFIRQIELASPSHNYNSPYSLISDIVKKPPLARTERFRSYFCVLVSTIHNPSSYIDLLNYSDELANHPECQEAVARRIMSSLKPWRLIGSACSSRPLIESPAIQRAIEYTRDDVIEAIRDYARHDSVYFVSDVVGIVHNIPSFRNDKEIEGILQDYIVETAHPGWLVERAIEMTSLFERPQFQKALANVIQRTENPTRIIHAIDEVNYLTENEDILAAIRSRSDDINDIDELARASPIRAAIDETREGEH